MGNGDEFQHDTPNQKGEYFNCINMNRKVDLNIGVAFMSYGFNINERDEKFVKELNTEMMCIQQCTNDHDRHQSSKVK